MFALMPWRRGTELLPRLEAPFGRMSNEFERMFNRFFNWPVMEMPEEPYPWGLTTEERENEVVVRAELPGFAPEELRVEWLGGRLTIEAEHKVPAEGTEKRPEREYAHVRRTIELPTAIEAAKVEATFRNGVLEIHLPRTPEAMARRIEVKA